MKYHKLKSLINKLPYVRGIYKENKEFKKLARFPAGHFYSPIVSIEEVRTQESQIWKGNLNPELKGLPINVEQQKHLLEIFSSYYSDIPFSAEPQNGLRYFFENKFYSYTDAIILYSIMRHFQPRNIIEIGSGFSSALMLDVNNIFFNNSISLLFVEPYPKRLKSLLKEVDEENCTLIEQKVQDVSLDIYDKLNEGDVLFVDSSHVVKTGSDVHHIIFSILPKLKKGVIVHFHDVFFPFEYPKEWVFRGFNWNETYFLRAFLMHNDQFEILFFSDYMHKYFGEKFKDMPLAYKNTGGNLWIRKKQ